MADIEAAVANAAGRAWGSRCTRAERHREMAEEYRRLSTIGSSTQVRSFHLRIAEHYSLLADFEEQGTQVPRR